MDSCAAFRVDLAMGREDRSSSGRWWFMSKRHMNSSRSFHRRRETNPSLCRRDDQPSRGLKAAFKLNPTRLRHENQLVRLDRVRKIIIRNRVPSLPPSEEVNVSPKAN
ncbi:MHC class I antigen [Anopheles sinensis]|uniref:MHC class I antigen n=1 Tax=Anopheles sinensis TaxID=74873 RepID=A0A084VXC1_ANOSI|nr:MHC class I antigen [Anopheles sinensis]